MSDIGPMFELSDMDLDEVSTVDRGDNPLADILIIKGDQTVDKSMPGGQALHHERPLDAMDFRFVREVRRKKNKKRLRREALDAIQKMERVAVRRSFR